MRSSRVGFAAFAATVSLCVFSCGVTGAVVVDGLLGHGALAAEQGVRPVGFGSGAGLGGGSAGRAGAGQSGFGGTAGQVGSGSVPGTEVLEPGAGSGTGASSNDRAVDRTLGLGKPQGKGLGAGAAGGRATGAEDGSGQAGATALGKPADKQEGEDTQSGTADAKGKDADGALEPEAMSAMAASAAATGQEAPAVNAPPRPSLPEIGGNGFFSQKIELDVPGFRGLEPKIALNYNSARKTRLGGLYQGWLGYGWGLDGFDVIERATPGYGYPAFDAKDVYLLNGEELVACATGMVAASCSVGGTHVTENENFKRVIFDAAANTWTVTDRDGTVSLFKSVMAVAGSTPASGTPDYNVQHDGRFLLSSVTDTNGNVVNYGYTCPDLPVCYPSVVSYGGMSVNFHYEDRPDSLVMANGLGLSYTKKRIKTVGVKVGTALRTAYALTYDQAPFSNTSRLTKVDRYGRDATVSSAGVITGPTVKTIRQMTYDNLVISYQQGYYAQPQRPCCDLYQPTQEFAVDFDSDGRDELQITTHVERYSEEDAGTTTLWDLYKFNKDGVGALSASVDLRRLHQQGDNSRVFPLVAGRFSAGAVKEVPVSYTYSKPAWGDSTEYYSGKAMISPSGLSDCYAAVCSQFYQEPSLSSEPPSVTTLDHDGDGVDIIVGGGITGMGDFAANGRQGYVDTNNGVSAYRFINGAWVAFPIGANCYPTTFNFYVCALGDLNGDGATDLVGASKRGSGDTDYTAQIWLSTGKGFVLLAGSFPWRLETALRDADNDGKVDIYHDGTVFTLGFVSAGSQLLPSNYALPSNFRVSGDFNGDGLPDLLRSGSDNPMFSQFGSGNPNLLRSVKLETGGTVSVDYTPSTRWTNTFMPQVLHAVTQLRVDDGRGQVASTDYAYAGGLYDPKARKFLGYKTITMTKPLANGETARPVVETTYRQDLASYGLPEKTVLRNGANTASKTVAETYSVNATTKPYKALNTATETTLNETGTPLVLRKERAFDAYGNISQIRDFGRKDLTGDETWTLASYAPNTTAYIVSLPRQRNVRSGGFSTTTDVYEQHQALYYDGSTDNAAPPTKGNLTILRSYGSVEPTSASYLEYFTYDSYGNKLSHVDGAGSRTEWDYDAAYHLYPVKERAPKYFATGGQPADARFVSTFTNDVVCGKPATKVDWNGVTETFTYDPFCRPFNYAHSGTGKYVNTRYDNEGNPALQSVTVYEPLSTGTGDVHIRTFYDGLGRPWRVQTPGETASGQRRITDTSYDARGNVWQTAFARFANETAQWTVNSYDWQDRVVKTVNPDASQRTYLYLVQTTAFTGSSNLPVMEVRITDEEGNAGTGGNGTGGTGETGGNGTTPGVRDPASGYYINADDSWMYLAMARGFHRWQVGSGAFSYAFRWVASSGAAAGTITITAAQYNAAGTATGYTHTDGYTYFRDPTAANEVPYTDEVLLTGYHSGIARRSAPVSTGGGTGGEGGAGGDSGSGSGRQHRSFTDKDNNVILTSSGQLSGAWVNEYRSYDAVGRLKGVRDNDGAVWTYTYDLLGNRLSASDPDLGTWTYTYDNANRLVSQTDGRGAVTTLSYDQMGRLLTKQVKAAGETTAAVTATNTYDTADAGVGSAPFHNIGLLTKSVNAAATQSFSRSLSGSTTVLTTRTVIDGITHTTVETRGKSEQTLSIAYTPAAVPASIPVGTSAAPWTYNTANKLLTVPGYISAATYEADGQTKSIAYANGVTTAFAYSPTRRWLTRVTTAKGSTVLMDNQYTRDKLGRIKTIVGLTTSDNWTYAYDDLDRLTSADNAGNNALDETYSYSASGNLLSRTRIAGTYTYPVGTAVRPHAATKIGTKPIGYDANGNMVSDGTRSLVWDRSNQLASVTQGGSTVTFSYGPDGSRVMKNWAFGKTLYAGADIEIDRTTPGAEVYTYYPHPDIKVVATAAGATSKFFLHRDHLSSVRLVTDAAGNVAEQTSYAAYGETTNPAMQTKKGYIGERFDVETGLMYLNARYYDPAFGRFIEKDDEADMEVDGERQAKTIMRLVPAAIAKPGSPTSANGTAPTASDR
ncbi:RHS repeat-associated core domain containing protein-containing protein [Rhizobium sp. CF080]|uniref:toxin TcdB middle/N-terminal domain-containing protein n=1 Tax=Rhizobium sp. (strain CF080) TaxID=1144310 RepID=UPI0003E7EB6B|nr:toxin TcdB middle/N-terminal domain-containing protein [Rhizobium sp. CF080]EUB98387.1 RHS repeat-associated core domain containing protein-containing protein [Rhizobium sp. CF080]